MEANRGTDSSVSPDATCLRRDIIIRWPRFRFHRAKLTQPFHQPRKGTARRFDVDHPSIASAYRAVTRRAKLRATTNDTRHEDRHEKLRVRSVTNLYPLRPARVSIHYHDAHPWMCVPCQLSLILRFLNCLKKAVSFIVR